MNIDHLEFPDFFGHPPPPQLSYEQYRDWVFGEIVPHLASMGEMPHEKLLEDFMKNEGRMGEFIY
jgi:hypothetical protein